MNFIVKCQPLKTYEYLIPCLAPKSETSQFLGQIWIIWSSFHKYFSSKTTKTKCCFSMKFFRKWVIHEGCPHKFGNFRDPLPLLRSVHIWFTTTPRPVRADTRLALFETFQLVNNPHWRVKKIDHSVWKKRKSVRMKTILEIMSLHCILYIVYWIQAEWKFYIQTYCQIIWVNFTNMVAII